MTNGDIAAYVEAMESLIVSRGRRRLLSIEAHADSTGYCWDDSCRQVASVYRRRFEALAVRVSFPGVGLSRRGR